MNILRELVGIDFAFPLIKAVIVTCFDERISVIVTIDIYNFSVVILPTNNISVELVPFISDVELIAVKGFLVFRNICTVIFNAIIFKVSEICLVL